MVPAVLHAALLLGLGCGLAAVTAQPTGTLPGTAPGVSLPGTTAPGDIPERAIPALPGARTAADTFRELLAMSSEERARVLAARTEYQRTYLEGRLREYEALPPPQREARLLQFELTCHLDILLRTPAARRSERLNQVPATLRPLIEDRLGQWDRLPPRVQEEVLEHETTANYFLRVRPVPAPARPPSPLNASSSAPGEKQVKRTEAFTRFLGLAAREQEKVLNALPASERDSLRRAHRAFARLAPEEQRVCLESFERFSQMTEEQRGEFFKSAARWQAMSARERETWRTLVGILPPLPPVAATGPMASQGEER